MKTLERIISLAKSSFALPRIEVTAEPLEPTHKEFVTEEPGRGQYICESGAPIEATPASYYGCREYSSPSGKYLFTESLPLEERYTYSSGCSRCGGYRFSHYVISKSAKPAIKKLETEHTKLSGKIFWMSWSLHLTRVAIPPEIKAYRNPEKYKIEGKINCFGKI